MTAPKVIWADPPEIFDGMDVWRSEPGGKSFPYIRADAPELVALVALIRDCIETSIEFQSQWDRDALAALAAYEALK